ncbi:MAG: NYN domain-containing protein [Acetobacteraceae bacterium]
MTTGSQPRTRIAVLVDAENVGADAAAEAMRKAHAYGSLTVRRAYRPWTDEQRRAWAPLMDEYAIAPVHVEGGKNRVDVALTIDAMDLLHGDRIDGLCVVSSDGDFTRLAQRARECGLIVICIGANVASRLRAACDHVEHIGRPADDPDGSDASTRRQKRKRFVEAVKDAIGKAEPDADGWARVASAKENVGRGFYDGDFRAALNASADFKVRKRQNEDWVRKSVPGGR